MRPNFALSLSHDGILLLHRTAAGWRSIGEADPASESLGEDLAGLQRRASALISGELLCKLVIPNDQIRYMAIETPGLEDAERRSAADRALEGATPYAVSELIIDVEADGDTTQIAAVARETLKEAEAFAIEHGFAPVSFVAIPIVDSFQREPFFGLTNAAQRLLEPGQDVARDEAVIHIVETPPQIVPDTMAEIPDVVDTPTPGPSFVSRRTVPTFRTDPPDPSVTAGFVQGEASVSPGFAEPPASFDAPQPKKPASVQPRPTAVRKPNNEAERLTVFGARSGNRLSNRFGSVGLLVAVFVVLFAGFAAFSSGAFGGGLSTLIARLSTPKPTAQFTTPIVEQAPLAEEKLEQPESSVSLASLNRDLTDEDAAVLDALRAADETDVAPALPPAPAPTPAPALTEDQLRADYADSGIWPLAPEVPSPPPLVGLEDLYITSIDPINPNFDAVALPALGGSPSDQSFLAPASPAPAGTTFDLDENGMVIATPEGSMNPDGIRIFAGAPAVRQPSNLLRVEDPGEDLATRLRLASFRPQVRPTDLIETTERATYSGLTREELGEYRPQLRPQSAQENALAAASLVSLDNAGGQALITQQSTEDFDGATARAVAASLRPDVRPRDFSATVAKIQSATPAPRASAVTTASAASVAPRVVAPKIPSSASASKEATVRNAINLRKVNLIGVYGKPSSRRALVRLSNGRYRKVEVGDSIDGGRVSAIGDAELRYQKSGRAIVLKMPRG
ncbi:hypothetical protein CEP88_18925 [Roseobacter denitrificans]|nr:hypothetical protein [Roseobacter denitrificans]AVL54459.1 hypothetical protein CEP88_18925 [Roseobacter denitrificans]SFG01500.1 hypothetical protein SAMN05443635_105269 [Roseobacter denitrificans OCh 114]